MSISKKFTKAVEKDRKARLKLINLKNKINKQAWPLFRAENPNADVSYDIREINFVTENDTEYCVISWYNEESSYEFTEFKLPASQLNI